jgi:cation transport ATPase
MSSPAVSSGQSSGPGESSGLARVELLVTGMTCAACAAKVEGRLNAIENVSATVNIATEKATVTAPPSEPSENGTGKKPGDEPGTKEQTASCLE